MFEEIKDAILNFFTSRITILAMVLILCTSILCLRLFDLQIIRGKDYMKSFQLRIKKERSIPGVRGNIYDRNGNLLAYNELANSVPIQDAYESGRGHDAKLNATIQALVNIIERNGDSIDNNFDIVLDENGGFSFAVEGTALQRFLADVYGRKSIDELEYQEKTKTAREVVLDLARRFGIGEYKDPNDRKSFLAGDGYDNALLLKMVIIRYDMSLNSFQQYIDTTVASGVNDKTVADVLENAADMPGVSVTESTARKYVDARYFSQIIGYTGKISPEELERLKEKNPAADYAMNDTVGKAGIEQSMENELHGMKGKETLFVDRVGKVIETQDRTNPGSGNDVYLTVDKDLTEAAYDILENRLAGILVSKIRNVKPFEQNVTASKLIIPIYDVYYALFNNAVIDITHFSQNGAGKAEKEIEAEFQVRQKTVLNRLRTEMEQTKTPYNKLTKEYKVYESYIVKKLYDNGVIRADLLDKNDKTYIAWTTKETISMADYLRHAISANWVDITKLSLNSEYSDAETIYRAMEDYILNEVASDVNFNKKLYRYLIDDDTVTGSQICHALLEQGVVKLGSAEQSLFDRGGESPYIFMLNRLRRLDITPAQLALDPCSGSMVITNVRNGDVLAMVSYPSYDNNKLANGVDAAYYKKLNNDLSRPLYNYATQQKTAPGSTFKAISATAGLMEGVITTSSTYTCTGRFDKIENGPICWIYPSSHGSLNVVQAIRKSCNVFFYNVGYNLGMKNGKYNSAYGLKRLTKYADMYGITTKTGIEIEESMPQASTQDAIRSVIGQGNANYTTVGLARYVTTVANRGTCYNLTLIDKITGSSGKTIKKNAATVHNTIQMNASYWDAICSGMRQVVEDKPYYNNIGVDVAGKTGTAQQITTRANHALFISFAPYENPEIAIATRIAYGYTSSYAAQITGDVYRYYYNPEEQEKILSGGAKELDGGGQTAD